MDKSCDKREIGREGEEEYGEIIIKEIKLKEQKYLEIRSCCRRRRIQKDREVELSRRSSKHRNAKRRHESNAPPSSDRRPDTSKRILLGPPFP